MILKDTQILHHRLFLLNRRRLSAAVVAEIARLEDEWIEPLAHTLRADPTAPTDQATLFACLDRMLEPPPQESPAERFRCRRVHIDRLSGPRGGLRCRRAHSHLYIRLLDELGLSTDLEDHVSTTSAEALADLESSIVDGFGCYVAGCEQLGVVHDDYYREHVHIDGFHRREMHTAIKLLEQRCGIDPRRRLGGRPPGRHHLRHGPRGRRGAGPGRGTMIRTRRPGAVRQLDGNLLQVELDRGTRYCEAACTHRGGRLVHGNVDAARGRLVCPLHRSVFDLETGDALGGPAREALWVSTEYTDRTSTP